MGADGSGERGYRGRPREGAVCAPAGSVQDHPRAWPGAAALAACLAFALTAVAGQPVKATEADLVKVAVFDFELDDRSAGGEVIEPDAADADQLRLSTDEARRLLAASGRYSIIETRSVAQEVREAGGIRHCRGCEGALALQLGADRSLAGILTRITRTEYTLQIVVRDAHSGAIEINAFTGLRMGANYSWPRGTRWLVTNSILE